MKNIVFATAFLLALALGAMAQTNDEAAIRALIAGYDRAYLANDPAFLEKNLAPEYSITNLGTRRDRARVIAEALKEKSAPTEKVVDFKSVVDSVRVEGSTAVVSGAFTWKGSAANDTDAVVHVDNGRFTMVFVKRDGRWLLADEHYSDGPHDGKMLEEQVLKMGLKFNDAIRRGDLKEYERFLADDYEFTNERGELVSRADDLKHFAERTSKIDFFETTDHKARWIGGSVVIETGAYRVGPTSKDGKKSVETGRYTTVWRLRDLRWQVVSDHSSGNVESK